MGYGLMPCTSRGGRGIRVEIRDAAALFPLRMDQGTVELWMRPDSSLTDDTHAPDWTYLFG